MKKFLLSNTQYPISILKREASMPDPLLSLLVAILLAAAAWLIIWPEQGFFWRWRRARRMTGRVLSEDALKHIYDYQVQGHRPTSQSIAGALNITVNQVAGLLAEMERRGLLQVRGDEFHLSARGRDYALHIVRAHRLWERYLADETGFAEAEWHGQAERREHTLSPDEVEALSLQLGRPTHDPHGDPIPTAEGGIGSQRGQPLISVGVDRAARIVHLEDEPEVVYAQLVAEGLHPGLEVRLLEASPRRVRLWAGGDEHVLAPIVAANISVVPLPQERLSAAEDGERLTALKPGQQARVAGISPACRGAERRRLMDLGVLPGTLVEAEMVSPGGDPTAYRVRGALLALRREQADLINITRPAAHHQGIA
ncbi:MAG: DtxR family transcriptional regulator [Anaerolineae bacterium]